MNPNGTPTGKKSPRNRVSKAKKKLQKSVKTLMQNNKYLFVFSIGLIGVSWILPVSFIFPMAAEISSETHVYRGIVILPSEHMPGMAMYTTVQQDFMISTRVIFQLIPCIAVMVLYRRVDVLIEKH